MLTNLQQKRFSWVIELVKQRKKISLKEINIAWGKSALAHYYGEKLCRQSWNYCFDQIEYLYGIIIKADKTGRYATYSILNPEIIEDNNVEQWILSCNSFKMLIDEYMSMYDFIDLNGYPTENGLLKPIVNAIKNTRKLNIIYQKYGCNELKTHIVDPIFVKTYKSRLYVLCRGEKSNYYPLSFDRIVTMNETGEVFKRPQRLTVRDFFNCVYGVKLPDKNMKAEKIVLRARYDHMCYMRDTPMHHSQIEINRQKDYSDFQLYIYPTNDFMGDVMQQGKRLEILKPQKLRDQMKNWLQETIDLYK